MHKSRMQILIITIVEPTGVPPTIDKIIPANAHITDIIADAMVTDLKLENKRIADNAGNIINAEISNDPTRFIASTIITAIIIDMINL